MAFYLRNDTEQWFSHIKDQKPYIETKFDIYYFCLMLGLAAGRKCPVTGKSEATEFQKNFVKSYIPVQKLIIGLLIKSELRRLGINPTEKDSSTKLTESGVTRMNEYASGGYDILSEEIPIKPYNVEDFLRTYTALLKEKAGLNYEAGGS